MKYTGETAVRLAERYGLPVQKQADGEEDYRQAIPLEDAQWILQHGDPNLIFVEAEPEMAEVVNEEIMGKPNENEL